MAHKTEFVATQNGFKVKPDGPLSSTEKTVIENTGLIYQNAVLETPDTTPVAVTRKVETTIGSGVYVVVEAAGTSVPADGEGGFSLGCLFSNPVTGVIYVNIGNSSSCAFRIMELGQSAITGPGAIPLTDRTCVITTTGADAFTVADGYPGQRLTMIHGVYVGDATITPDTPLGFSTITLDTAAGSSATIEWFEGLGWGLTSVAGATIA